MPIVKADATFNERKLAVPSEVMVKLNSYNVPTTCTVWIEVPMKLSDTEQCCHLVTSYRETQ